MKTIILMSLVLVSGCSIVKGPGWTYVRLGDQKLEDVAITRTTEQGEELTIEVGSQESRAEALEKFFEAAKAIAESAR